MRETTRRCETSPAHTRAWIETARRLCPGQCLAVARSHAGVDRNCRFSGLILYPGSRPLTRGRGSKLPPRLFARTSILSPAHTRAWIETCPIQIGWHRGAVARSHAGVDRNSTAPAHYYWSFSRPLTRGRGSKLVRRVEDRPLRSSPAHTRAWIETDTKARALLLSPGRPLTCQRRRNFRPAWRSKSRPVAALVVEARRAPWRGPFVLSRAPFGEAADLFCDLACVGFDGGRRSPERHQPCHCRVAFSAAGLSIVWAGSCRRSFRGCRRAPTHSLCYQKSNFSVRCQQQEPWVRVPEQLMRRWQWWPTRSPAASRDWRA